MKKILIIICFSLFLIMSPNMVEAFSPGGYNNFKITTSGYEKARKETGGFSDAPTSITNAYKRNKDIVPNEYFDNLYEAFLGGENGSGALYVVMVLIFMAFVGKKLLDSSLVMIETLSGISAAIPDLVGSALTEATTKAIGWAKKGLETIGKAGSLIKSNLDEKGSKTASKLDKFGDNAEKSAKAAGNAVDKGAQAAGSAVGKMGSAGGKGLQKAGGALSTTGVGAIVGVPLMVAGAAGAISSKVAEYGIKAAGKSSKYAIKTAGKAAKYSAKASKKTIRTTKKISNGMKTAKAASNKQKEKKRKYKRNR